jgi:hypothetical protein
MALVSGTLLACDDGDERTDDWAGEPIEAGNPTHAEDSGSGHTSGSEPTSAPDAGHAGSTGTSSGDGGALESDAGPTQSDAGQSQSDASTADGGAADASVDAGGVATDGGAAASDGGIRDTDGGDAAVCEVDTSYAPELDPQKLTTVIDNPYWPLVVGTRWVFEGGGEYVEVTVTDMQKQILGVPVVVVRDTVRDGAADAAIVEDTYDWYAQDDQGNVWYMGEDTKEYENGDVVSTEGSWEAGVDGAQPGIVMYAQLPAVGEPYRQEYLACEAEDFAELSSTSESVSVPFGDYEDCIKTREYTPLEPGVNEFKYYCAGVGLVLEEDQDTGDRVELTDMTPP